MPVFTSSWRCNPLLPSADHCNAIQQTQHFSSALPYCFESEPLSSSVSSRRSLRSSRNAGERADRGSGEPVAELFVTRWNEAVNVLHVLDEGMKTAAETAVGGPAEQSGIFPQPEAICQKCSVFLALSLCPKPLDSYIPQFLLVLLQNHISQCHFFLTVVILSFTWPTILCGPVPTGHKSWNLEWNTQRAGVPLNFLMGIKRRSKLKFQSSIETQGFCALWIFAQCSATLLLQVDSRTGKYGEDLKQLHFDLIDLKVFVQTSNWAFKWAKPGLFTVIRLEIKWNDGCFQQSRPVFVLI